MCLTINDLRKRQDFLTTAINSVITGTLRAATTPSSLYSAPMDMDTIPKTVAIALDVPVRLIPDDLEDIIDFSREFIRYTLDGEVTVPRFLELQEWFLETHTNTKEVNPNET